jgi:hypothetical protein
VRKLSVTIIFVFLICLPAACGSFVSRKAETNLPKTSAERIQPSASANQNQAVADPQLSVKMARFSWTHTLLYQVEIEPDGKVLFEEGKVVLAETKPAGPRVKAESQLEKEKMRQLLTAIENSDFFALDAAYGYRYKNCPSAMSDHESVRVRVKLNGREKTIDHDLGCYDLSYAELKKETNRKDRIHPQQLYRLENKIDEIAATKRWIGEGR